MTSWKKRQYKSGMKAVYRQFVNTHIASITLLVHQEIMIFFYKNDHTPGEDHDEQYCALGIHQKGGCAAK